MLDDPKSLTGTARPRGLRAARGSREATRAAEEGRGTTRTCGAVAPCLHRGMTSWCRGRPLLVLDMVVPAGRGYDLLRWLPNGKFGGNTSPLASFSNKSGGVPVPARSTVEDRTGLGLWLFARRV